MSKKKKKKKSGKRKAPILREAKTGLDFLTFSCAPCPRCGYFLTSYRTIVGNDAVNHAAENAVENWVTLEWSAEVQHVMQQLYGIEFSSDAELEEIECPDCRRQFTLEFGEAIPLQEIEESVTDPIEEEPEIVSAKPLQVEEESNVMHFDYSEALLDVPFISTVTSRPVIIKMQFSPHNRSVSE